MSKATSLAARHWSRILGRWPEDRMRPQWVAVQTIMQKRIDNRLNPPTPPTQAANSAATKVKGNEALVTPDTPAPAPWNEAKELAQANAMYSLLENRYMKEYPIPETLRYPQSNPEHYDILLQEFEEAPDRSWLERLWLRLKGSVRMQ